MQRSPEKRADADNDLYESDEDNNEALAPVTFYLTDPSPLWVGAGKLNDDGSFELSVRGSSGVAYTLQTSTDLLQWTTLVNIITGTNNDKIWFYSDYHASSYPIRFYRVSQPAGY